MPRRESARKGLASERSSRWKAGEAVGGDVPETAIALELADLSPGTLYRWRSRVQLAPATVPLPANPVHGSWRRYDGQAVEADIRAVPEPGGTALGLAILS